MMFPLVAELAAEGVAVVTTCRVLGFSTQAFYKWRNRPYSDSERADAHLINELKDLHADDPESGCRFHHDELVAAGHQASVNRVHQLYRENQVWSVFAKKKGFGCKAGPPVHDDLVKRHFKADSPDLVWLTDITEHWTDEGKVYMCAFKDVCSGRIVGYAMLDRMTSALAVRALDNVVVGRDQRGTIIHSDRGSQFRSRAFVARLKHHKMTGSMGRVGACFDAVAESFWASLKRECFQGRVFATRAEARRRIFTWINWYSTSRLHSSLDHTPPNQWEQQYRQAS